MAFVHFSSVGISSQGGTAVLDLPPAAESPGRVNYSTKQGFGLDSFFIKFAKQLFLEGYDNIKAPRSTWGYRIKSFGI